MPYFTKENAREFSKMANYARWHAPKPEPEPIVNGNGNPSQDADVFGLTLARACTETLELLRKAKEPQQRAQYARALRDLRETWHLATGKPRPGQTRPDSGPKQPVRRMPSVFQTPQQPMPIVSPSVPQATSNGGEAGNTGPQGPITT